MKYSGFIQKTQRKAIKFLKYSLLSGSPLVIVGYPPNFSKTVFRDLVLQSGHCFASSFYFAKTLTAVRPSSEKASFALMRPGAFVLLGPPSSPASYRDFVLYARENRIPVLNFMMAVSPFQDYFYYFDFRTRTRGSLFLSWVLCRILRSSSLF